MIYFNDLTERLDKLDRYYIIMSNYESKNVIFTGKLKGKQYDDSNIIEFGNETDWTWKTGLAKAKEIIPFSSFENAISGLQTLCTTYELFNDPDKAISLLSVVPNLKYPMFSNCETLKNLKKINNIAHKDKSDNLNYNFIEIAKNGEFLKNLKTELKRQYTTEHQKLVIGCVLSNKQVIANIDVPKNINEDVTFTDETGTMYYAIVYKDKFMWRIA